METNRYAPPRAIVHDVAGGEAAPPLWNPNAAANWSLLLSPIFGAWLHMMNWRSLGEMRRAAAARVWIIVMGVIFAGTLLFVPLLGFRASNPAQRFRSVSQLVGILTLVVWYFGAARAQARYVRDRFGKDYPRRGWVVPIAVAIGAWIVCFMVLVAVFGTYAYLFMQGAHPP